MAIVVGALPDLDPARDGRRVQVNLDDLAVALARHEGVVLVHHRDAVGAYPPHAAAGAATFATTRRDGTSRMLTESFSWLATTRRVPEGVTSSPPRTAPSMPSPPAASGAPRCPSATAGSPPRLPARVVRVLPHHVVGAAAHEEARPVGLKAIPPNVSGRADGVDLSRHARAYVVDEDHCDDPDGTVPPSA